MRMHCIRHVDFEDEANIALWAGNKGFSLRSTNLFAGENLPDMHSFDWLVVMGGPMGVHDENIYPWMKEEKQFLKKVMESGKKVIGVCLGAQLMAEVLGGRVVQNAHKEIGWFPVHLTQEGKSHPLFHGVPASFFAYHWHGETFSLPPGCIHLVKNQCCELQAFAKGDNLLGLQFHLETTRDSMERLMNNCASEIETGPYVQSRDEMREKQRLQDISSVLTSVLDNFLRDNTHFFQK